VTKSVVLAFSGGLGTIAALHILRRQFGRNVITYTANLGQKGSTEAVCERAIELGAASAHVGDLRQRFLTEFVWPAIRAGAVCESGYALAHALARPLIVSELVRIAREEGAQLIAHGCAGKSNDQVRFEVSAAALGPDIGVLSPLRQQNLLRRDELFAYCRRHRLPTEVRDCRFSITENLFGTSVQWDRAPDPFAEVPEGVHQHTRSLDVTPDEPLDLVVSFNHGVPCSIDGASAPPIVLIERLRDLAGEHGVGRLQTIEDRLIGIKMVEVYEQPAATILHTARAALERLVLAPDLARFKGEISRRYAHLVYQGFWFSELREALDAFVEKATRFVTGDVRLRLFKGTCRVTGVRSRYGLYRQGLAEPTTIGDEFVHGSVPGFLDTISGPIKAGRHDFH